MTGKWCLTTEIVKKLLKPGMSNFDFEIICLAAMTTHRPKLLPNPSIQMPCSHSDQHRMNQRTHNRDGNIAFQKTKSRNGN